MMSGLVSLRSALLAAYARAARCPVGFKRADRTPRSATLCSYAIMLRYHPTLSSYAVSYVIVLRYRPMLSPYAFSHAMSLRYAPTQGQGRREHCEIKDNTPPFRRSLYLDCAFYT
eukprot:1255018-Rhodomonas_salina.1